MAYFFVAISALVTGGLLVVVARLMGMEHNGILVAIAIIGVGAQLMFVMAWYLFHTRPRKVGD